ncbi:MAG TPA: hypothetical protein PKU95_02345 [Candidatus Dojkabacteria bacterium]|nr:hypothetical protein [Candidatus Dojkabacteria bacterium]
MRLSLRIPVLTIGALIKKALGFLSSSIITQISTYPIEAFRSNVCNYGVWAEHEECPLYQRGVCKGPNNNGVAKIGITKFHPDEAHCIDVLDVDTLTVLQDDVAASNARRFRR